MVARRNWLVASYKQKVLENVKYPQSCLLLLSRTEYFIILIGRVYGPVEMFAFPGLRNLQFITKVVYSP